ncbi:hypothetical protein F1C76_19565 [Geodermatophilaceae bacterium NBWT11]|nr:hypothetical protein F1C76_19565 [Geodermatophilaceae bacterium NBWT11]
MITPVTEPGRQLIESGFGIAGSMTAAAATVVYSPADAALQLDDRFGGCLRELADDLADAALPRRERARAGAALAFAVEHGVTLSRRDRRVRADGFFTERAGGRVAAREIGEGVLWAARGSADDRRVRHLGYLLAEVVVSPDVDAALADRVLRTTARLSWRQLVLLAAVGRRERSPLPLTPVPVDARAWTTWGAVEDLTELQQTGLLDPPVAVPRPGGAALARLRPADLRLTRRGVLVHRLLALDVVRADEVDAALAALVPG